MASHSVLFHRVFWNCGFHLFHASACYSTRLAPLWQETTLARLVSSERQQQLLACHSRQPRQLTLAFRVVRTTRAAPDLDVSPWTSPHGHGHGLPPRTANSTACTRPNCGNWERSSARQGTFRSYVRNTLASSGKSYSKIVRSQRSNVANMGSGNEPNRSLSEMRVQQMHMGMVSVLFHWSRPVAGSVSGRFTANDGRLDCAKLRQSLPTAL